MGLFKICPCCGTRNSTEEMMCTYCLGDISHINPSDDSESVAKAEVQVPAAPASLVLIAADGSRISLGSGEIIGRSAKGAEIFQKDRQQGKTVSRKHARFSQESGGWTVTDLNSGNGTFLNDARLTSGEKKKLNAGDRLSFSSSSVEFTVKFEI
ncbi:MAG: FHA domain-containing protein [Candidatus Wallbacteria bacterium]|nr:FHA domain-containing protein [Candidatus Wallbacteria bacterium]